MKRSGGAAILKFQTRVELGELAIDPRGTFGCVRMTAEADFILVGDLGEADPAGVNPPHASQGAAQAARRLADRRGGSFPLSTPRGGAWRDAPSRRIAETHHAGNSPENTLGSGHLGSCLYPFAVCGSLPIG